MSKEDEELTEMKTDEEGKVFFDVNEEDPDMEDLRKASEEAVKKLTGE